MRHIKAGKWVGFILVIAVTCFLTPGVLASEMVIGHNTDPSTLNPIDTTASSNHSVIAQIVEPLVHYTADGSEIVPLLATSWEWIDSVTLEMRLKKGIFFTNGEPMNAEAAVFSMERFIENPGRTGFIPPGVYKESEIIDDYTFRVHLHEPYAAFVSFLATYQGSAVVPPDYYNEVGMEGFGHEPIGTGPFVLTEWIRDSHIILDRNPDYWGEEHPIRRITYRIIPEETVRITALETGEIDIAFMLPVGAIGRLQNNDDAQVVEASGLRKFATYFDTIFTDGPIDDPRVRTALNYAVDKEMIIDSLFSGAADPLPGQFMLPHEFGHNPEIHMFGYDPEKARELLAEAGYADGFSMELTYTVGRYAQDRELGEVVASYLEQVGVQVTQRGVEAGTFFEMWREATAGNHQWGLLVPSEPHFNLSIYAQREPRQRYVYHNLDLEFTRLIDAGVLEMDLEKREKIYHQAAQMMYDDPIGIFLIVPRDIYGISNRVQGFEPPSDQIFRIHDISLN